MAQILFADDDASLRAAMRIILTNAGHEVIEASNGRQAIELYESRQPDLVILDVMMPGVDGFEACRKLREKSQRVPLLLLSAKTSISDKMTGFRTGADDYLTKPFDHMELVLHVESLLRRTSLIPETQTAANGALTPAATCIKFKGLRIDRQRREVYVDGALAKLTPIEYDLLEMLAEQPGRVYSRDEIAKRVWGDGYTGREVAIPTHIRHLREKTEADPANPEYVKTVGRFGYRLGD